MRSTHVFMSSITSRFLHEKLYKESYISASFTRLKCSFPLGAPDWIRTSGLPGRRTVTDRFKWRNRAAFRWNAQVIKTGKKPAKPFAVGLRRLCSSSSQTVVRTVESGLVWKIRKAILNQQNSDRGQVNKDRYFFSFGARRLRCKSSMSIPAHNISARLNRTRGA